MGKLPFVDKAEVDYLEKCISVYLALNPKDKKKEAALVLNSAKAGFHERFRQPPPGEEKAITALKRKRLDKVRHRTPYRLDGNSHALQ